MGAAKAETVKAVLPPEVAARVRSEAAAVGVSAWMRAAAEEKLARIPPPPPGSGEVKNPQLRGYWDPTLTGAEARRRLPGWGALWFRGW